MPMEKDDQEERSWEEEEPALKNNSKNLEPKIDKLKKLEQEKKNLEKEVHEVKTKLNAALTIIKDERKVNEIYWKRIKNLQSLYESSEEEITNNLSIQSLYKSSEEKLTNKVKRLKGDLRSVHQKLKDTEEGYQSVLNHKYQLILNNEQSKNETS